MKKVLLILSVLIFSGCSNTRSIKASSTGIVKTVSIGEINSIIGENNFNYQLVYLSIGKSDENIDNIFFNFGDALDKKGLLLKSEMSPEKEKKIFLNEVQKNTNSNFEYYDSPFLIFYKVENEKPMPYKVLSFNNISEECLEKSLLEIEKKIDTDTLNNDLNTVLYSFKMPICEMLNDQEKLTLKRLFIILKKWYNNVK